MKYNIISHLTTACNYDCSYCDVVKDKKMISNDNREKILIFIQKNSDHIERFKFFGWEPFLAFKDMKYIIGESYKYIWKNYEVVTNTTLLTNEVWEYLEKYFSHIFFSIDSENDFNYEKVISFIQKYNLEWKLYFNLVISPWKEQIAREQFQKLYDAWMRGFNILPVYFTQSWSKKNLADLSHIMKSILDLSLRDTSLRLYGFMENAWYDTSLANNTIFIDIDGKIYYSDMASTFSGKKIKENIYLWNIDEIDIWNIWDNSFAEQRKYITLLEERIYASVPGQRELHKIMDYFSEYLSSKKN